MTSNEKRFAYAGDSHVYIYDLKTFKLEKILPFCDVSVTNIMFHPTNSNVIGCLAMDSNFEIWDIEKEKMIFHFELEKGI